MAGPSTSRKVHSSLYCLQHKVRLRRKGACLTELGGGPLQVPQRNYRTALAAGTFQEDGSVRRRPWVAPHGSRTLTTGPSRRFGFGNEVTGTSRLWQWPMPTAEAPRGGLCVRTGLPVLGGWGRSIGHLIKIRPQCCTICTLIFNCMFSQFLCKEAKAMCFANARASAAVPSYLVGLKCEPVEWCLGLNLPGRCVRSRRDFRRRFARWGPVSVLWGPVPSAPL